MIQPSTAQRRSGPRHAELLRRRRVSGATLIVGTLLLCATLRVPHGSTWFTVLGFLVAATWIGGAFLSGPIRFRPAAPLAIGRVVGTAVAVAILAYVAFVVAYLVAERLPVLSGALDSVLDKADAESTALVLVITLVNGVGEELFFRGALFAAVRPRAAVASTTLVYVIVTAFTLNVALVVAAIVMGTIFAFQRRATRSVLAPVVTHLTWSTLMLLALPR